LRTRRHRVVAVPHDKEEVFFVIPVTLWIVLFGAALSAGAVIGALATVVIYGLSRTGHGRLTVGHQSFSLVASGTTLTMEAGSSASRGLAAGVTGEGPRPKARAQLQSLR
jgi:hypothetical protein